MNTVKIRAYTDTAQKIKALAYTRKGWSMADEIDALYRLAMSAEQKRTYQIVIDKMQSKV